MTIEEQLRPVVRKMVAEATSPCGYEEAVRTFRRVYLLEQLRQCGWNQCHAAIVVGIHRNTLARQMQECGITAEDLGPVQVWSQGKKKAGPSAAPQDDKFEDGRLRA